MEWAWEAKRSKKVPSRVSKARYWSYVWRTMKHMYQKWILILRRMSSFSSNTDTRSGSASATQREGMRPALASTMRRSTGSSMWSRAWSHAVLEGSFSFRRRSILYLLSYEEHSKQQSNLMGVMSIVGLVLFR